jgi:hypothetical protein
VKLTPTRGQEAHLQGQDCGSGGLKDAAGAGERLVGRRPRANARKLAELVAHGDAGLFAQAGLSTKPAEFTVFPVSLQWSTSSTTEQNPIPVVYAGAHRKFNHLHCKCLFAMQPVEHRMSWVGTTNRATSMLVARRGVVQQEDRTACVPPCAARALHTDEYAMDRWITLFK